MQITIREKWRRARSDTKLSDLVKHEIGVGLIAAAGSYMTFDEAVAAGELQAIAVAVVAACFVWPVILLSWNYLRAPGKIIRERIETYEQRIRELESVLEPETESLKRPMRDWTIRAALCWWKGNDEYDGDNADQLNFFYQLRQAARDGDVTIWGRKDVGSFPLDMYAIRPLEKIEPDYWQNHHIDPMPHLISKDPDFRRQAHTYIPGGYERERFHDLMVSSAEIKNYGAWEVPKS